jgi:hypothetical protein
MSVQYVVAYGNHHTSKTMIFTTPPFSLFYCFAFNYSQNPTIKLLDDAKLPNKVSR